MKRNWITALSLAGAFAICGVSLAQEASKNEEKKEEKKTEVTVKSAGKIIMVGPDGKVTEKTFGDDHVVVEGKPIHVEVKGGDGEEKEIVIVTPDGTTKKTIVMKKVDVNTSETKDGDGKKTLKIEAKVVGGDGEKKTIILSGDGKSFDVKGVGIDVEKIKKLVEEKKGDVKPDEILAIIRGAEGKPLGGAIKLQLHGHAVEGHPHVVLGAASASGSAGGGDVAGKLDKILDRLEKLEERLSKLEKKD